MTTSRAAGEVEEEMLKSERAERAERGRLKEEGARLMVSTELVEEEAEEEEGEEEVESWEDSRKWLRV